MLIGEVAKRTGFSKDTIRWYEKIGLIKLDRKQRRANNYKEYPNEIIDRLLAIQRMKAIGFTIKEIEALLVLDDADLFACGHVGPIVQSKLEKVKQQIRKLQAIQLKLEQTISNCQGDCKAQF